MLRPSRRREMALRAVQNRGASIRMACEAFRVSQTCYRYVAKADAQNEEISNWLLRLTDNHRNWGFGLCFLYLRNVRGFGWNHKSERVIRMLKQIIGWRGTPLAIRCDNGPEHLSGNCRLGRGMGRALRGQPAY